MHIVITVYHVAFPFLHQVQPRGQATTDRLSYQAVNSFGKLEVIANPI